MAKSSRSKKRMKFNNMKRKKQEKWRDARQEAINVRLQEEILEQTEQMAKEGLIQIIPSPMEISEEHNGQIGEVFEDKEGTKKKKSKVEYKSRLSRGVFKVTTPIQRRSSVRVANIIAAHERARLEQKK